MHDLLFLGRVLIQMQTEFLKMCARGALCARTCRISAVGGRLQKSAPSSLMVLLALLTMVHHHFSAPTIYTKQTFLTFIFYYATLFRQRHAVHTASRIFAIDGRLHKSASSSLTLLAMIYHHCSISTTSTKCYLHPLLCNILLDPRLT